MASEFVAAEPNNPTALSQLQTAKKLVSERQLNLHTISVQEHHRSEVLTRLQIDFEVAQRRVQQARFDVQHARKAIELTAEPAPLELAMKRAGARKALVKAQRLHGLAVAAYGKLSESYKRIKASMGTLTSNLRVAQAEVQVAEKVLELEPDKPLNQQELTTARRNLEQAEDAEHSARITLRRTAARAVQSHELVQKAKVMLTRAEASVQGVLVEIRRVNDAANETHPVTSHQLIPEEAAKARKNAQAILDRQATLAKLVALATTAAKQAVASSTSLQESAHLAEEHFAFAHHAHEEADRHRQAIATKLEEMRHKEARKYGLASFSSMRTNADRLAREASEHARKLNEAKEVLKAAKEALQRAGHDVVRAEKSQLAVKMAHQRVTALTASAKAVAREAKAAWVDAQEALVKYQSRQSEAQLEIQRIARAKAVADAQKPRIDPIKPLQARAQQCDIELKNVRQSFRAATHAVRLATRGQRLSALAVVKAALARRAAARTTRRLNAGAPLGPVNFEQKCVNCC